MKRKSSKDINLRWTRGLTQIEVITILAIAAIVLSVGVSGFQTMFQNNRKTTAINDMRTALALARSTAITRRARVTVCKSANTTIDAAVCTTGGDWSQGWIVFVDPDAAGNNAGVRDPGEELLRVHEALKGSDGFSGNATVVNRISFTPQGMFENGFGGTLTYQDPRGSSYGGRLIISSGGQVRYEEGSG